MGIIVAIGIVVIAITIIGMFVTYNNSQSVISQQKEESNMIQNERVKEDIAVKLVFNHTGSDSTMNLIMNNTWGDASAVSGLMIKCDDGRIFTESQDGDIVHGSNDDFADTLESTIDALKQKCATGGGSP